MSETESKVYKGDVGTEVLVDCGCVITGATVKKLKVKQPDGTLKEWVAEIEGTNFLKYITVDTDFTQDGTYYLQAYVELTSGKWSGETAAFTVYKEFQ